MSLPLYRAAPPEGLIAEELEGITALYHRASGQTHLVSEPVPELLAALMDPLSRDVLLARLGLEEADREALTARLEELVAAGLVVEE